MADDTTALGAACDDLNAALAEIEAHPALHLGVAAKVQGPDGHIYGFGKMPGGWRLFVVDEKGSRQPVQSMSRVARLAIVDLLPAIVASIRENARAELERTQAAASSLRAFTASLNSVVGRMSSPEPCAQGIPKVPCKHGGIIGECGDCF